MSALGTAIRSARGSDSPTQFAARLGIDQSTLYRWETGRAVPRGLAHARALEKAGVPPSLVHEARQAAAERTA